MEKDVKKLEIYDSMDPDEEEQIISINDEHKQIFEMAIKVLRLSYETFPVHGNKPNNNIDPSVERVLLALYSQAFRSFRSIIILCRSGLDLEALIQGRSLLETVAYLLYIAQEDHVERFHRYLHSRALSKKQAVEEFLLFFPEDDLKNKLEWYKRKYEEAIQYFKEKHGAEKTEKEIREKYTIRATIAAQNLKEPSFIKHYKIFYRYASFLSHGEDPSEYIKPSEDPSKFVLMIGPTETLIPFCLDESMMFMCSAIERLNELLGLGFENRIKKVINEAYEFVIKKVSDPEGDLKE